MITLLRQVKKRTFFGWFRPTVGIIEEADHKPKDAKLQSIVMDRLLNSNPREAVQRYESGLFSMNNYSTEVYLRALYKTGQFERLVQIVKQSPPLKNTSNNHSTRISTNEESTPSTSPGTKDSPVYVKTIESYNPLKYIGTFLNFLLTAGILYTIYKSTAGQLQELFNKSVHKTFDKKTNQENVKFEDVQGCDEAKEELAEIVDFLKNPGKFTKLGARLPKGVLLVGPPGTGKTLLAKAVAGEANVPFIYASGAEFDELFVGVGSMRIKQMFASAKAQSPCILFLDEIDALGSKRNPLDQKHSRMTLNQLLVELDGFQGTEGVVVIAATNFPDVLDKALLRPGRFDKHVTVPLPDVKGRCSILELYLKDSRVFKDVNISTIARSTPGFSGADLSKLVNQAKILASKASSPALSQAHLEAAKDEMLMGQERKSAVMVLEDRQLTAYHESGHAIMALSTPAAMPIHKATIVPRGRSLGMLAQLPERDQHTFTKQQLLARLDVAMGGRVAEELVFGADFVTTGAASDFEQATAIARAMVTQYGMSESIGCCVYPDQSALDDLSPHTKQVIDQEVRRFLEEARSRAVSVLQSRRHWLDKLASKLLEEETLSKEQIEAICY